MVIKRAVDKVRWANHKIEFPVEHRYSNITVDVVERPVQATTEENVVIAKRILTAFKKTQGALDEYPPQKTNGDLWDRAQAEYHKDFYAIYHDPKLVVDYLNDMNRKGITWGTGSMSPSVYMELKTDPTAQQRWGLMVKDTLVNLGESLGVLPKYLNGDNMQLSCEEILSRVESVVGTLTPSSIEGGLFKLKIGDKYFDHLDWRAIYVAYRAKQIGGSVAEIGGGIGKAALFAHQMGIKDYAIYDLPIINVAQAWYLIKSGVEVCLYGEDVPGVKILPPSEFRNGTFNLTVNIDGFPEMDETVVTNYLKTIKRNSKVLLSINQEEEAPYGDRKHILVPRLAEKEGLTRLSRHPFWFYRHYVEELYTV